MSLLVLPDLFIRHSMMKSAVPTANVAVSIAGLIYPAPMMKSAVSVVPTANVAVSFAGLIYPAPDGEVGSVGSTGSQGRC